MGYKALIDRQLVNAFNAAKDLATDVVITSKSSSSFDFGSNTATEVTADIATKAVMLKTAKKSTKTDKPHLTLMLKTAEVGDLKAYDTLVMDGATYKLSNILKSDGYITLIEATEE